MKRAITPVIAVLALVAAACGGSDSEPAATTITPVTTAAPTTTTTNATTTTSTTSPPDYPVSQDYVVETVVSDLDAAAGGLAIDDAGNLYTADFGYPGHEGNTVFRITPDGTAEAFAQSDQMGQLAGNAFGPDGTLYQSSYGSGEVFTISPEGEVELLTDRLAGPAGIVVTEAGRVFVDDCNINAVYEVFPDGSAERFARDTLFNCPNGLTMDDDGNLYMANFQNGRLFKITPEGEVSEFHEFPGPNGHVLHYEGQLFVTGRVKHQVYRIDLVTGLVEIIAGSGGAELVDGPGAEAEFGRPNAIAIAADGTIYFNHGTVNGNEPTAIRAIRRVG